MTIRNDATRLTIRAEDERHPRSVVGRQGQVLLDADLDQQSRHLLHRVETATGDMLGADGRLVVPAGSNAFSVAPAPTPEACGLGTGHGYLGGWLVENATDCLLHSQPHPRTDTTPTTPVLLTLKALVRYVDPVEEPAFADRALGDAQAAGRTLVDWQVFPFAPAGGWGTGFSCATATTHPDWTKLAKPSSGTLAVVPDTAPPAADPCTLVPQGGYSRHENLLYRIEVHGGIPRQDHPAADGPRFGMDGLTLKLSRRNASVMARVVEVDGTHITVDPPALDPLNWFSAGAYAEFVSKHDDVDPRDAATGKRLFQVARTTDVVVTLETAAAGMAGSIKDDPAGWFLRLWDAFPEGKGVATARRSADDPQHSERIDLGDGLWIRLGRGGDDVFRRGDYWTFSARADGSVDWPTGQEEPPHGPQIRYAPLAALTGPSTAQDCRGPAAALTDSTLLYRGGDGQEIPAPVGGGFVTLPGRLRVAVMRGRTPVAGATVTWTMPAGGVPSRIDGSAVSGASVVTTMTDAAGLCEVGWALDAGRTDAKHQVQVALGSAPGTAGGPPLVFTAGFRTAAATSYQPGACALLQQATTVQEALDVLCAHEGGPVEPVALQLTSIELLDPRGEAVELVRDDLILNGLHVAHNAFAEGITLSAALRRDHVALESTPEPLDPIVEVELDLPYPGTDPDKVYWASASSERAGAARIYMPFGFHRVRLDGTVAVTGKPEPGLVWRPSKMASEFLATAPLHHWGHRVVRDEEVRAAGWHGDGPMPILCRLRVRSAHVWAHDPETGRQVYLNAEHLGVSAGVTNRELLVRESDPQRAADLDLFFYLEL
ncbi:hypothetical protein C1I97_14315 [Streptomyces sp. NTH33]|uniref:DUF6519 domain-containing protein n=1 Tax=Streptomyces sp. NTH33 TaxID=1735453 RepID=UPI000DA7832A|nr:DUF6519 domain-containing protein [Streptomyces sp. NTH33]PZH09947.1 hypothetical protein C1I97_14315 [Streptomyces sp. NTH33]